MDERIRQKEKRQRYIENGQCPNCGKPARPGMTECQACVDKRSEERRERSEAKKNRGECVRCTNQAADGQSLCEQCNEKNNEKCGVRRDHRRNIGVCQSCGKPSRVGKKLCASCAKKDSAREIKQRQDRIEDNQCIGCGEEPVPGYARCQACLDYQNLSSQKRRQTIEDMGLCRRCKSPDVVPGGNYCEICVYKNASGSWFKTISKWHLLKEQFESQGGLCPYFGVPLQIGVDAWLDHKIPRAKGGTNDLENLQWVHVGVNRWKGKMTHDEFIEELKNVVPNIAIKQKLPGL